MNAPKSTSLEELVNALQTLSQALTFADESKEDEVRFKIARDACIQRFEYCIELAWKTSMKALGSQVKHAKVAVREMARADLIDSAETWLSFVEARNQTSHTYDDQTARKVYEEILRFHKELPTLIHRLKALDP